MAIKPVTGDTMKVVAREKISNDLELVVVKPDKYPSEKDMEYEEKLGIELYENFPFLAKYKGQYLHLDIEGCDLEDDQESATGTMLAQAEFHKNNPNWIVDKIKKHKETICAE